MIPLALLLSVLVGVALGLLGLPAGRGRPLLPGLLLGAALALPALDPALPLSTAAAQAHVPADGAAASPEGVLPAAPDAFAALGRAFVCVEGGRQYGKDGSGVGPRCCNNRARWSNQRNKSRA
jgi:hypothetical protein